jgi:hypothetical protein
VKASRRGQATVEQALIIPVMVFLVLGIVQLGMSQQARLMTEYAAYRAARTGIVTGGNCPMMRNAATVALLPTFGVRVDDTLRAAVAARLFMVDIDTNTGREKSGGGPSMAKLGGILDRVRVEVLNPRKGQLASLFSSYGIAGSNKEIDFDDIRNNAVVEANLLSVRVTHFHEMRIPFANALIYSWFVGFKQLDQVTGGVLFASPTLKGTQMPATQFLMSKAATAGSSPRERDDFRDIATLAEAGIYVLPMKATYSMRMQSNLMFNSGAGNGGVDDCAIDP